MDVNGPWDHLTPAALAKDCPTVSLWLKLEGRGVGTEGVASEIVGAFRVLVGEVEEHAKNKTRRTYRQPTTFRLPKPCNSHSGERVDVSSMAHGFFILFCPPEFMWLWVKTLVAQ